MASELRTLVELSRTLGEPGRDLVILAEGNTSIRTGPDRMLVKASGSQLGSAAGEDFVEVGIATMLDLVNDETASEGDVKRVFGGVARGGKRPSVEAMLHAICLSVGGATVVGHTHPVPVNIVLCSPHAERLSSDVLFPEQVVILGRKPAFVPYLDPGLTLARAVQQEMLRHIELDGAPPKVVYLGNHGLFALGESAAEVLQITAMAVKVSRILGGALTLGGVRTLSEHDVARIDGRPDEIYRRQVLAGTWRNAGRRRMAPMTESLRDQVAVVTGASSGIGLAIARALAAEGVQLVLGARSQSKLDDAVATLGEAAIAVRADVTDTADVEALIGTAIERHGRIDILIANAGVYAGGDFADADPGELLGLIDTNVGGILRTVHAALTHMIPAGTGNIVITSSVAGHQVTYWEPVYSASKHAVHALTHGIRRQLIGTGVRIGSVAPGVVLNDLWKVTDAAAVQAGVAAGTGVRSEDVADAVLYMLTRPSHVNIRDLVILPVNQEI